MGVMAGQPVKILNSDATMHNIHGLPKVNREFNFGMPKTLKEKTISFDKSEDVFVVKCDVHPWMKTWVVVLEHPYWAVTDADGNFSLDTDKLEPGTYDLCFWHEKWDKAMKGSGYCSDEYKTSVTIADKAVDAGTKIFKRPAKKK